MAAQLPPGIDLWTTPAGAPPPGVIPDLEHPETNQNIALVTLTIFLGLATIFLGMRLYVQFIMNKHKPWWDDVMLILAWPPQVAFTGITIWMCTSGLISRHIWETPIGVVLLNLPYWTTLFAALGQPITGLVKLSLLLLYLRIFQPNHAVRYATIVGIVIVTMMYTIWMFVFIFESALSDAVGSHLSWAQAAFNVATDVYIFILPISGVINLNMPFKRKLGILAIFSTGLAALVMSILTLYWRVQYNGTSPDPTWSATDRCVVTVLEIDIGMMVACMPLFAPLLPKKNLFSSFVTMFRSTRSRLLGSYAVRNTTQGSQRSDGRNAENGAYYEELGESGVSMTHVKKSTSNSDSNTGTGRKEWFDQTGSVLVNTVVEHTVVDRTSKDVSQMA